MYIELSARGSGKTERFVKAVREHLKQDWQNIAVVVSARGRRTNFLIRNINGEGSGNRINYGSRLRSSDTMHVRFTNGEDLSKVKYFVHEFEEIDPSRLNIVENAYYVATLKRRRKYNERDFLTCLLEANNGVYSSYAHRGDFQQYLQAFGRVAFDSETRLGWQMPDRRGTNREQLEKLFETVRKNESPTYEALPFHKTFEHFLIERLAHALEETNLYIAAEV